MNNKTIEHKMVTTAFTLEGYRIVKNLGVVKGIYSTFSFYFRINRCRITNDSRGQYFSVYQTLRTNPL